MLNASRGSTQPHVEATYTVLGVHPERVWDAIVARRKAMLGADYDKFFAEGSPKKPVQSVRSLRWKEERKRGRDAA